MTEDEIKKYTDDFTETSTDKRETFLELQKLGIKNIEQWRLFTSTLLTIDIAIIAAVLALFSNESQKFIHIGLFSTFGLVLLIIDALFIVWYSTSILIQENEALTGRRKFLDRTFTEIQELGLTYISRKSPFEEFDREKLRKMKGFSIEEKRMVAIEDSKEKGSWYLSAMSWLFIIGLTLIAFSMLPTNILITVGSIIKV